MGGGSGLRVKDLLDKSSALRKVKCHAAFFSKMFILAGHKEKDNTLKPILGNLELERGLPVPSPSPGGM